MIRGITRYQRQEQRYTMNRERFLDRIIFIGALFVIVWLATGGGK